MGELLLFIPVLLFSVILHEVAHGWVALREGDPTAYMLGRLTLNPIPHIDLFGSILVPLMLWMSPARILFGWAKPVPVNSRNFRHFRRGEILVSLAGIVTNLLLAVAFTLLTLAIAVLAPPAPGPHPSIAGILQMMAAIGIRLNVVLAFFNLIPIPPLDGSHVLYYLLPPKIGLHYRRVGQYGMVLLLLLMFVPGALNVLLWPASYLTAVLQGLIPGSR